MVTLAIEGREIEIAPYKIKQLKRAAPIIDRLRNSIVEIDPASVGMTEAAEAVSDMLAVLAIGAQQVDEKLSADYLEEHFGLDDMAMLQKIFADLMIESGLRRSGEVTAPPALDQPAGASQTNSDPSFTTSSPQE